MGSKHKLTELEIEVELIADSDSDCEELLTVDVEDEEYDSQEENTTKGSSDVLSWGSSQDREHAIESKLFTSFPK